MHRALFQQVQQCILDVAASEEATSYTSRAFRTKGAFGAKGTTRAKGSAWTKGAAATAHLKKMAIAMAAMGDPNASIPTPQPVHYRPMFGAFGGAIAKTSLTFVSQAALTAGVAQRYGLAKAVSAVRNIRGVRKQHLIHNDATPVMEIDHQTYAVRADGQLLTCEPAKILPMAQKYFLF